MATLTVTTTHSDGFTTRVVAHNFGTIATALYYRDHFQRYPKNHARTGLRAIAMGFTVGV